MNDILSDKGTQLMRLFFKAVSSMIVIGECGINIDKHIRSLFDKYGCVSAPIKEYDFPGNICISINDCMCHGIPDLYKFQHGDLVSVDISFFYEGHYYDAGRSFVAIDANQRIGHGIVSTIELNSFNAEINKLTIKALSEAFIREGDNQLDYSVIGKIYLRFLDGKKYMTSAEYGGHRIGEKLHMAPFISSISDSDTGVKLQIGHRFCFEPLLTFASGRSKFIVAKKVGWPVYNVAKDVVTHYENTYLVTKDGIVSIT